MSPTSSQRSNQQRQGFTLIELLVVIAIISIIAAILFPVFARAREAARRTSCLSNLKQWALAVNMYAQDYDGNLPQWYRYNQPPVTSPESWMQVSLPYVKNVQIAACPSYSYKPGYESSVIPLESYTTSTRGASGKNLAAIDKPSETIFGFEGKSAMVVPGLCDSFYCGATLTTLANALNTHKDVAPHLEGVNVFFVDGHAKWMNHFAADGSDFSVP